MSVLPITLGDVSNSGLPALHSIGLEMKAQLIARQSRAQQGAQKALDKFETRPSQGSLAKHRRKLFRRWINKMREDHHTREASKEELSVVEPAARTILEIGARPMTTIPSIHGDFKLIGHLCPSAKKPWTPNGSQRVRGSGECWTLYIRALVYEDDAGFELLSQELVAYATAFPARAPWAHAVSDELDRVRSAGESTVRLCYVGITVASTPLGRISHDLDGDDPKWTHFVNYADVIQKVRSQHAKPAALWEIYEFQHGRLPCTVLELRRRAELQAAERAVIAAYEGLGLNSAAGGFHHLPEYLACQPDER